MGGRQSRAARMRPGVGARSLSGVWRGARRAEAASWLGGSGLAIPGDATSLRFTTVPCRRRAKEGESAARSFQPMSRPIFRCIRPKVQALDWTALPAQQGPPPPFALAHSCLQFQFSALAERPGVFRHFSRVPSPLPPHPVPGDSPTIESSRNGFLQKAANRNGGRGMGNGACHLCAMR